VPEEVATKKGNIYLERGQLITSIQLIAEGVTYYEWGIPRTPNKKTILDILQWLENRTMITRESNAQGTKISIINWTAYQPLPKEKVTEVTVSEAFEVSERAGKELCKLESNAKETGQLPINTDTSETNSAEKVTQKKRTVATTNKDLKDTNIYIVILDFWNSQEIIVHRDGYNDYYPALKHKLKEGVTEDQIKASILNYKAILAGNEYFFNYRWTLKEFLMRGFDKFLDGGVAKVNYRSKNGIAEKPEEKRPFLKAIGEA